MGKGEVLVSFGDFGSYIYLGRGFRRLVMVKKVRLGLRVLSFGLWSIL